MSKTHKVTIKWGKSYDEVEDQPVTYTFVSDEALQTFMKGVDAAVGWLEYEVVDDD